jgi:AAA+ ATPase superfamily predicted ATPase
MNPFTFGNPIKEPERFIGRKAEIRQILNRLLSSAHESTSIIGERRIGKTSLLSYLAHPEVSASLGLTPDKFCLVYVDFQGLTDITPTRFWQRILKKMARSICDEDLIPSIEKLSAQSEFDLFDLEDLFQTTMDKGLTIVLLMDEFEYVTENPNFKNDFFGGLRALAIHSGVALVPATRRELVELCHSEEIKGSPFFNIFANVVLRPFSRDEVNELLSVYIKEDKLSLAPKEKNLIWELGGGYPLFVQIAGHYLFDGKEQGLKGEALVNYTTSNFDQQGDAHYTYLWSHCSESEKITLIVILTLSLQTQTKKTIADGKNLSALYPRSTQDIVTLGKRGMVNDANGVYSIFSPSLERWVRHEILAAPGESESETSAEEWLKSGGHEDIKGNKNVLPRFKKKYWPLVGTVMKEVSIKLVSSVTAELIKSLW